jgi:hypothetical protein
MKRNARWVYVALLALLVAIAIVLDLVIVRFVTVQETQYWLRLGIMLAVFAGAIALYRRFRGLVR